jgi:putative DNA primase/helicase
MPATGSTSTAARAAARSAPSRQATGLDGTALIVEAAEMAGWSARRAGARAPDAAAGEARSRAGDRHHPSPAAADRGHARRAYLAGRGLAVPDAADLCCSTRT